MAWPSLDQMEVRLAQLDARPSLTTHELAEYHRLVANVDQRKRRLLDQLEDAKAKVRRLSAALETGNYLC